MNENDKSLLIFKAGDLNLVSDILRFTSNWCRERGMKAFIKNTADGYEIYATKEPTSPPDE